MQNIFEQNLDKVLTEIGLGDMPEADRQEAAASLVDHFSSVMIETIISNLSDEQIAEFKEALALGPEARDEKITEITAKVPGLSEKIEQAVELELKVLKSAKESLG